jgi:hypothetical protein
MASASVPSSSGGARIAVPEAKVSWALASFD